MRNLPSEVDLEILRLLLEGSAYRQTGRRLDVSISTVARVAEEARKKEPDFDSLRTLAVHLRKAKLSIFDATRASGLFESLNKLGIGLDVLDDYVRLSKRLLLEKDLSQDYFFYAVKLAQLEETYGRTYQEIVEDFEKKKEAVAEAEESRAGLEDECRGLAAKLKALEKNLAEIKSKIEEATSVWQGLAELGVDKLAKLVRFFQDFESMKYDARQVKKLAIWRRRLKKLHIDPDGLDKFITERGPLETQNNSLRLDNERIGADVTVQAVRRETLIARNSVLAWVDRVLTTRTFIMPCRSCRYPMPMALPTKESLQNLIDTGQVLLTTCPNCGLQQTFSPWEIALQIAWPILPPSQ